jgi:hypothetical protein
VRASARCLCGDLHGCVHGIWLFWVTVAELPLLLPTLDERQTFGFIGAPQLKQNDPSLRSTTVLQCGQLAMFKMFAALPLM